MAEQETLFERLARERNITVEEMRAQVAARIERGWNDPDPEKKAQWRKIPCAGDMPTPEEWLKYTVERLIDERRGRKCRKPMDFAWMEAGGYTVHFVNAERGQRYEQTLH